MSRINETRQILWNETCKCVPILLGFAVCNTKQIWNDDKCRCECREDLVHKIVCDKGFSWNPSNCECECDKSCGIEECTSVIEENKICNETSVVSSSDCDSCTACVVLFVVFLLLCLINSDGFICFYWYKRSNKEKIDARISFNPKIQLNY